MRFPRPFGESHAEFEALSIRISDLRSSLADFNLLGKTGLDAGR
jgi:hypothetical protein